MANTPAVIDPRATESFRQDSEKLGELIVRFIDSFYPAYNLPGDKVKDLPQENSLDLLNSFSFYRICECKIYNVKDRFAYFAEKLQKLFTTAYSIKREVCYGIVSSEGKTALVLGVSHGADDTATRSVLEGLLPGIKLEKYTKKFTNETDQNGREKDRYVGCVCGVPALKLNGEYLNKDLSPLMRSLNGKNYTLLVMCKPVDEYSIQEKIDKAIQIQDECFGISKRTLQMQQGSAESKGHTDSHNESRGENHSETRGGSASGAIPVAAAGAAAGAAIGSVIPGAGTAVGAVAGGLVGLIVGKQLNFNRSKTTGSTYSVSTGYSDAVTETINRSESISGEVQNGFALELMKMAETMAERLKIGRSIGMWQSVVSYSSDDQLASDIIKGSLYREIASGIPEVLPPVVFSYTDSIGSRERLSGNALPTDMLHNQQVMIPRGFFKGDFKSSWCSLVTSE